MAGSRSARRAGASRSWNPVFEALDRRELMTSGGLTPSLGPYINPSEFGPRLGKSPKSVNPSTAVNQLLTSTLGAGLDQVQSNSRSTGGGSPRAVLKQTVANESFVHSILSNADTYTLFGSPALSGLIGSQQVSGVMSTGSSTTSTSTTGTSTTSTTSTTGTTTTPTPSIGSTSTTTTAPQLVGFSIPSQATIQSIGTSTTGASTSIVQVNPSGGSAGFFATVPTTNIRILSQGPPQTGSVLIPASQIPTGFPTPTTSYISIGTFSATYQSTGPLLNQIFKAGVRGISPNAPNSVPGLRLAPALLRSDPFPSDAARKDFAKALRLAVQRDVFTLNSSQTSTVSTGINQFAQQVQTLIAAGQFTPLVPIVPPTQTSGKLSGTLEISVGAVRRLGDVDPTISGLQLPSLGNFQGRLDVGYVFDRSGNYGISLSVRGALQNANGNLTPADVASGDVRIEVSNASTIGALSGRRIVEGVEVGSGVSSDLEASTTDSGIKTFSASTGDGYGLEFGTGIGYSTVIPLGNVFALIPSSPRR